MKESALGFTLVELLVVISIIAVLSVIGVTVFSGVQKSARDAKRRGDIDAISKALEVHYGKCAEENLGGAVHTVLLREHGLVAERFPLIPSLIEVLL